jgi:opacity protein-like surface antigen
MKKTIIALAVASAALASVAFAGGYAAAPQQSASGAYVEGMAGGANRTFSGLNHNGSIDGYKHQNWGWALGLDAGYQFNKALAAELGGFWVSKATAKDTAGDEVKVGSWLGYAAGRVNVPLMSQVDLFMKGGLGWNHTTGSFGFDGATVGKGSVNGFTPVFGVGLDYNINPNLYVSGAYTYFGNSWNSAAADAAGDKAPKTTRVQLLTLGLGYRFQM